ncbi:unnamed protein product [Spirodela intermedia]|uniref:Uncharacterized protein n=1 Tax=Spirodela intermedia TaxID=51605 RepID=A0A7I8JJ61_SPIIN|nr:unnamed protein product [Spirodela intermedia]CAA6670206.1 unnamed protein product [Spirodela intermedia]
MVSSSWKRTLGNVRSFVGNSLGGLRGGANLASWARKAALAAASDPYAYVEKRKPIPDPQETGLIYGKRAGTKDSGKDKP